MHITRLHILPVLLLLMVVVACSRHPAVSDTLAHAEAVMEEHPDSALAILEAIPDSTLTTKADRALHALLLSQALDKNYIDITSDSLINIAVDYYSNTNSDYYKAKSLYYRSRIEYNNRNMVDAIITLLDAESYAIKVNNNILLGLIYRNIADIYGEIYASKLQVEYAIKSYDCFVKTGDRVYIDYAKLDVARAYIASGDLSKAIKYASEVRESAGNVNDSSIVAYALLCEGNANFGLGNYKEAIEAYESSLSKDPGEAIPNLYKNMLDSYLKVGDEDNALLLKKRFEVSEDSIGMISHFTYSKLGEWENAYNAASQELKYQDSAFRVMMEQSIMDAVMDFQEFRNINTINLIKAKHNSSILLYISIILVLIIIIGFLYYNRRKRILYAKIAILKAQSIRELLTIERRKSSISEMKLQQMQNNIHELFLKRFEELDNQIQLYYECVDINTSKKRSKLVNNIISSINSLREDESRIKEIEDYVNFYLNNLMSNFRKEFPLLKKEEYMLFLYLTVGFSPKAVCVFLNIGVDVFYNRKSRLKKKIKDSQQPNAERFLRYIG